MFYRVGRVSKERIRKLEEQYGLTLPEDYRNFLEFTNGGMANRKLEDEDVCIPLKGVDQTIIPNCFYGLDTEFDEIDIDDWLDRYADEMPENVVLIGDAAEIGFLALFCGDDEDAGVYYWDDRHYFPESSDEENTYFVAESFSKFMELCEMPLETFTETHAPSWIREYEE